MSNTRFCQNCGTAVEEETRFCSECGTDLNQQPSPETSTATNNVYSGTPRGREKGAIDHITTGYQVALEQPTVFIPSIISGVLGLLVSYLTYDLVGSTLSLILSLAVSIISFILSFASTDISRDAYYKQPLDLMNSVNYVTSRFLDFLLAAIFGGLLSITVILIPVVIFMFVIMVMDEVGIMDALKQSISVIQSDFVDVLVVIVVSIVASVVIGYVPLVSTLLDAVVNVILGIAFIDIYATYKAK